MSSTGQNPRRASAAPHQLQHLTPAQCSRPGRPASALGGLAVPAPVSLVNAVFGSWLAAPSRLGEVFVTCTGDGVTFVRSAESVRGDPHTFAEAYRDRFGRPLRPADRPPAGLLPALCGHPAASPRLDLRGLSDFERAVLEATGRVPAGQTRPYGWIAREAGSPRAVRAVGSVLARNPMPLLVPCHRVVRADGRLGDYIFGPAHQEELLRTEEVNVDEVAAFAQQGVHFLGSDTTGVVCFPTCHNARRITDAHRRGFRTIGAAVAAGYRPCRHCRPAPVEVEVVAETKQGGRMIELIPRERRTLAPGAVHVPAWLTVDQQRDLVTACRGWAAEGPGIRAAALPNGARMSVHTVCLGWHWYPYRYSRTRDDQDGSPVTPFPEWLADLGRAALAEAYEDPDRARRYRPDIALINHYDDGARMGLHRDSDEDVLEPVVSLSIGAACVFRLGNTANRGRPWTDVELHSGDLLVFGDESRLAYHGVPKLLPAVDAPDTGLASGRLNITLRVSGRGSAGRGESEPDATGS